MFRAAKLVDLPGMLRLYSQLQPDDPTVIDGSDVAVFEQILGTTGLDLFVLERDGAVVATTYLNVIPNLTRSASPYALIENVVVEERLRGTGLGKLIMAETIQAAWAAGCYKVMLMTGSKDPATHAFYRSCGLSADTKTGYAARRPADWPVEGRPTCAAR
jgi:GNAT superfamily N-acetyltransferase